MNARSLGFLAAVGLLTGCMTTTMHRAQTLGKGGYEVSIEPGVAGFGVDTDGARERVTLPSFWVAARYGVSDRFDVGGRLGSGFLELHTNVLLTNPMSKGVRVAIAPNGTPLFFGVGGAGAGVLLLNVPVLVGIPIGESELTLGPGFRTTTFFGAGGGEAAAGTILEPSVSAGISLQLGNNFRFHPEFGWAYGATGFGTVADAGADVITTVGASRFSFALGFQFGSPNRKPGGGEDG